MSVGIKFRSDDREVRSSVSRLRSDLTRLNSVSSRVGSNLGKFGKNIHSHKIKTGFDQVTASVERLDGRVQQTTSSIKKFIVAVAGTAAVAGVVTSFAKAGDSVIDFNNKLRLVTGNNGLKAVNQQLKRIAIDTNIQVDTVATSFNRLGLALEGRYSNDKLLQVTKTLSQAAKLSGGSAESINAALIQLGQGLASNELRGQELLSVMEQAPRIARAIADGMGLAYGDLRKVAQDGQLTADKVMQALLSQSGKLEEEFSTLEKGASASFKLMLESIKFFFGEINQYFGASTSLGYFFKDLSEFFFFASEPVIKDLNRLKAFLSEVFTSMTSIGRGLYNKIVQPVVGSFRAVAEGLVSTVSGLWDRISAPIEAMISNLKAMFWDFYIWLVGNSVWPDTWDAVVDIVDQLWPRVAGGFKRFFKGVVAFSNDLVGVILSAFTGSLVAFAARISWFKTKWHETLFDIRIVGTGALMGMRFVGGLRGAIIGGLAGLGVALYTTLLGIYTRVATTIVTGGGVTDLFGGASDDLLNEATEFSDELNRRLTLQDRVDQLASGMKSIFEAVLKTITVYSREIFEAVRVTTVGLSTFFKIMFKSLSDSIDLRSAFLAINAKVSSLLDDVETSLGTFALTAGKFFGFRLQEALALSMVGVTSLFNKSVRGLIKAAAVRFTLAASLLLGNNTAFFSLFSEGIAGATQLGLKLFYKSVDSLTGSEMAAIREKLFLPGSSEETKLTFRIGRALGNIINAAGIGIGSTLFSHFFDKDTAIAATEKYASAIGKVLAFGLLAAYSKVFRGGVTRILKLFFSPDSIDVTAMRESLFGGKKSSGWLSAGAQGKYLGSLLGLTAGFNLGTYITEILGIQQGSVEDTLAEIGTALGVAFTANFLLGLTRDLTGNKLAMILRASLIAGLVGLTFGGVVQEYIIEPLMKTMGMSDVIESHSSFIGLGSAFVTALGFAFGSAVVRSVWTGVIKNKLAPTLALGFSKLGVRGLAKMASLYTIGGLLAYQLAESMIDRSGANLTQLQTIGVHMATQVTAGIATTLASQALTSKLSDAIGNLMNKSVADTAKSSGKWGRRIGRVGLLGGIGLSLYLVDELYGGSVSEEIQQFLKERVGLDVSRGIAAGITISVTLIGIEVFHALVSGLLVRIAAALAAIPVATVVAVIGAAALPVAVGILQSISNNLDNKGVIERFFSEENAFIGRVLDTLALGFAAAIGGFVIGGPFGAIAGLIVGSITGAIMAFDLDFMGFVDRVVNSLKATFEIAKSGWVSGGPIGAIGALLNAAVVNALLLVGIDLNEYTRKFVTALETSIKSAFDWGHSMWFKLLGMDLIDWKQVGIDAMTSLFEGLKTLGKDIAAWFPSLFKLSPDYAPGGVRQTPQDVRDIADTYVNPLLLEKKATGGHIRGPGTGTSDSIPTMLSDGEYVIKASSVRKLGVGFLDAVNQGRVPQHRAEGGLVNESLVPNTYDKELLRFYGITSVDLNTQLNELKAQAIARGVLVGHSNGANFQFSVKRGRQFLNVPSMHDVNTFGELIDSYHTTLHELQHALDYSNGRLDNNRLKVENQANLGAIKMSLFPEEVAEGYLRKSILSYLINDNYGDFPAIRDDPGLDQFPHTQKLIRSLSLGQFSQYRGGRSFRPIRDGNSAYQANPEAVIEDILTQVRRDIWFTKEIGRKNDLVLRLMKFFSGEGMVPLGDNYRRVVGGYASGGHVRGPGTGTSDSIPAMLSDGEYVIRASAAKSLGTDYLDRLNNGGAPLFRASGGQAGSGSSGSLTQALDKNTAALRDFEPVAPSQDYATSVLENSGYARKTTADSTLDHVSELVAKVAGIRYYTDVERASAGSGSGKGGSAGAQSGHALGAKGVNLKNLAKRLGVSVEDLGRLSAVEFQKVVDAGEKIKALEKALENTLGSEHEKRRRISEEIENQREKLGDILEDQKRISDVTRDSLKQNFSEVLRGADSVKDAFHDVMGTITSSIIDRFAEDLTDSIFDGFSLDDLIDGMFKGDAGISEKVGGWFKNLDLSSLFGGLFGGGGGGLFSGIFSLIGGIFGFANGGYVSGPGGPRQDSIPAMLSNGEYVVNAAATDRYFPLLDAINSGQSLAFADGGRVGPVKQSAVQAFNERRTGTTQEIHISVTGDVSRQTRQEIARMIPQITQGVNATNREKGR